MQNTANRQGHAGQLSWFGTLGLSVGILLGGHARSRGGDLLLTQTGPSQQKAPLRQLIANNKLLNYPAGTRSHACCTVNLVDPTLSQLSYPPSQCLSGHD